MFIDSLLLLSSAQAVTATAASTNSIDTLAASDAYGREVWVEFLINTSFTGNSATIQFALETDSDSAFGSPVVLFITGAIADTTLVAGYYPARFKMPIGAKRYLRAKYTVSGTAVAGKIDCRLVADENLRIG